MLNEAYPERLFPSLGMRRRSLRPRPAGRTGPISHLVKQDQMFMIDPASTPPKCPLNGPALPPSFFRASCSGCPISSARKMSIAQALWKR